MSRFKGRETTLLYRVERFEPGRAIALHGHNKTVTSVDTISLVAHDGWTGWGTRPTSVSTESPGSPSRC